MFTTFNTMDSPLLELSVLLVVLNTHTRTDNHNIEINGSLDNASDNNDEKQRNMVEASKKNWTNTEHCKLCISCETISMDPVTGVQQKCESYWESIHANYMLHRLGSIKEKLPSCSETGSVGKQGWLHLSLSRSPHPQFHTILPKQRLLPHNSSHLWN